MLDIARREAPRARFVQGSLLDAPLPDGCVGVTATGEALNYAVDPRAGDDAFAGLAMRIERALVPGGVFLGDMSVHGRSGADGVRVQFHDRPDWSVGVRETEDETTVTREIATFWRLEGGTYARTDERHVLHLYDPDWVRSTLETAGFEVALRPGYAPGERLGGWVVVLARRR
jgi:hypothetical protein